MCYCRDLDTFVEHHLGTGSDWLQSCDGGRALDFCASFSRRPEDEEATAGDLRRQAALLEGLSICRGRRPSPSLFLCDGPTCLMRRADSGVRRDGRVEKEYFFYDEEGNRKKEGDKCEDQDQGASTHALNNTRVSDGSYDSQDSCLQVDSHEWSNPTNQIALHTINRRRNAGAQWTTWAMSLQPSNLGLQAPPELEVRRGYTDNEPRALVFLRGAALLNSD